MAHHSSNPTLLCFPLLQCLRICHRFFAHLSNASIFNTETSFEHLVSYLHYTYSQFSQPHATLHLFDYSLALHCWVPVMYPSQMSSIYASWTPRYPFISIPPYFILSHLFAFTSFFLYMAHDDVRDVPTFLFLLIFTLPPDFSQRFAATLDLLSKPLYIRILTCIGTSFTP
jgi:hypothetical protein